MEYWPEVIQVIPTEDYEVYVYFDDGNIKLFNAATTVKRGAFKPLQDKKLFVDCCTVLNGTLAWSLDKSYDCTTCIDIEPFRIYQNCKIVPEPLELFASSEYV